MKIVYRNVLWIFAFATYQYLCAARDAVTVGVFFNQLPSQSQLPLNSTIHKKNIVDQRVNFASDVQQISDSDSFEASKTLCNMIESENGVAAVISGDDSPTMPIQESISVNFEIPFIMLSWRATQVRDDNTVLNFYPEAERFARGLAEIVQSLRWKSFVIIYETEEGLIRMQEILKLQEFKRDAKKNSILVKQLGPGPDYRTLLKKIRNSTEDNIILDCETHNVIPILLQAKSLNMLNLHNNYFITSLDAHILDFSVLETLANITTIRLFDHKSEDFSNMVHRWVLTEFENYNRRTQLDTKSITTQTALFHDALLLLMDSINDLSVTSEVRTTPINCNGTEKSIDGFRLYNYMRIKSPSLTLTGPVKFDESGNRIDFNMHVVDILDEQVIATWFASNESLILNRDSNETLDAAVSNLQKIKVIVSSRIGKPYLMERTPRYDGEILTGNARYEGYSMDLIAGLAKIIGFQFEFQLAEDGKYGNWDAEKKRWTGLVGDLLERKAHLAICDLTITHERREVVDFSMPFMTLGISILYKRPDKKDINMFAFLDPFSVSVWIYTATLYLIISIILYFISRMTPGDWENPHPCNENPEELENIWDIKNCLWLTLGSIMTQGCDILPKGISSRIVVSMWWFFSLIMTSSYTANLAAFLTKANMEPPIDGAEALSKQTKIKYGLLEGGSTESFFKNSNFSTYQRMWLNMQQAKPSVFEKQNSEGVTRVQTTKNGLYAFLMESTQIEYEVENNCELKQIGNWLDTKSYGIAMPMNSPYRSAINKAVLKMQESGDLGELKKKWWKMMRKNASCDTSADDEDEGSELALANVGGVFLVLGLGIGIAFILAILEFLWNVRNVSVEEHMSYWEALKVEVKFACNIWITRKRTKPLMSESSSSNRSDKSERTDNRSMIHSILRSAAGSFLNINNK